MDMENPLISKREGNLLYIAALVMVGILCAVIIDQWSTWRESGPVLALLVLFSIVLLRLHDDNASARQTHLYLSIQTLIISLALIQGGIFVLLFFILSAQAMMYLPTRAGLRWIGIFALVTLVANFYTGDDLWISVINSLVNSAGFLFFGVFGNALMRAESARAESQRLLAELQQAHHQLQEYAESVEALAIAEERNRLSREMHDTLGHRLTVSIVQLEGAGRLIDRDTQRAAQMIGTVREQLVEGLDELRRTLAAMRNPGIGSSLPKAIQTLAKDFQKATQMRIHTDLTQDLSFLADAQRMALYRTAQEALTNAQRHAQAQNVWLTLTHGKAGVELSVRDDGCGMDLAQASQGIGLHGMRERASQLHGQFEITSAPGHGTELTLRLPSQEEKTHA